MSYSAFPGRLPAANGPASSRYSAKNNLRPINFTCVAPQAKQVSVVGDFNEWNGAAHPMKRQPDGAWILQVPLSHGPHRYLFEVDGQRQLDPRANGTVRNDQNERLSLVTVS